MSIFTFRQAPLKPEATYVMEGSVLTKSSVEGTVEWVVDLRTVTSAHYTIVPMKVGVSRELFLNSAEGERRVYFVLPKGTADPADGFKGLMREIGQAIETAKPGFMITKGLRSGGSAVIFGAAVVSLVFAIGMVAALVVTGTDEETLMAVGLPLLAMAAFGAWGAKTFWPWRKPAQIPAKTFPR